MFKNPVFRTIVNYLKRKALKTSNSTELNNANLLEPVYISQSHHFHNHHKFFSNKMAFSHESMLQSTQGECYNLPFLECISGLLYSFDM